MKKILLMAVAAFGLLATSCSKDEVAQPVAEKSTVTFAVAAPELATRAELGDGTTAVDLAWAVYAEDGTYLEALSGEKAGAFSALKANVEIELVNGKKYQVIFWAQAPGAPYTFDKAAKKVTVADALTANQEAYDAFYKLQPVDEVKGPRTETVVLTRPFAQLNIATADTAKAKDGGLVVAQTKVVVPAYKTLNLADGSVADETERTYAMADILTGETIEVGGKTYDLLSMNYLLVNAKELETVKFTVKNGTFEEEFTYNSVPFQRNYKTNIIGNLLTSTLDFEITIDPIFSSEIDYDGETGDVSVSVATIDELQDAINKATGNATIKFEQDINAEATRAAAAVVTVPQKEGVNITIDGCNFKFDGTFDIYGGSRHTGKETLTFKNINFEHTAGALDFLICNTTDSAKRYAHNVTIEDCTFTGNSNGDVVGMRWRQCYNIVVKNVEATNMHSLMWAQSSSTITVDGAKLVNCLNGISVGQSTNVLVKNFSIDGGTYGLRADGTVATTLTVADCNITAAQPIIVRNLKAAYDLVLEGENTLTTTEKYQIILTNGSDDEEYVTPTGDYTLTGAEDFYVFEREAIVVENEEELSDALTSADDVLVELGEGEFDLESQVGNSKEGEVTIVGNGMDNTIVNGASTSNNQQPGNYAHGKHVVLRDLTFVTPNNGYQGGFGHAASVTFINCKIIGQFYAHSGAPHKFVNCTIDPLNGYLYTYASDCDFEGCTFESSEGKALQVYEDASVGENTVNINNCTFKAAKVAQTWDGKPVTAIDINSNGAKFVVNINNCTAEGYGVGEYSGSNLWNIKNPATVVPLVTLKINGKPAMFTVASADALKAAIAEGRAEIGLADGVYKGEFDFTHKTTKLVAVGDNAVIEGMVWADDCNVVLEGLTLTNPDGVQHPNPQNSQYYTSINNQYPCVGAYNKAKVLMKNCTFNLTGPTVYGFYGYAHNDPVFEGCTFNCNKIRPIASNGDSMTVTGCTFNDQYHYSVRIYENDSEKQTVVFTNNVIQGSNDKGEFEGINISKKGNTAIVTADFTIKGNTAVKYRHHSAVTMSDACTYDSDIANFSFESE